MNNKLLTISIAAYNVAEYIINTLDSLVLEPEYMEKIEVLVIDDGSKDDTARIAAEYADRFPNTIKVISKSNGGYGSTINTSLKNANGKYFKLLDGDDWYKTSHLYGFIDYLKDVDSDIVLTPYYTVITDEQIEDRHKSLTSHSVKFSEAEISSNLQMHELSVKTSLLIENDVNISEHCFYTDEEFVFNCMAYANTISRYNKPIYCYRLGLEGQSVSLTGIRKHYKDFLTVSEKIYSIYNKRINLCKGTKEKLFKQVVEVFTYSTYRSFLLLENPVEKKEQLVSHDKHIKECYFDIYQISMKSSLIKLMRRLNFSFYGLFCKVMLKKFRMNNI